MNYSPSEIEPKWQEYWQEHETFVTSDDSSKPKYYVLDMFPYPSGSGLHVGHGIGYTVTDTIARHKRMKGFNVLHPMGWDSFGLPAEQYAIRTGAHPAETTDANIATFKEQLQEYGYSYDWSRELRTSEPEYYKWTQWIFSLLYEKGLAYQAEMYVNYCPNLGSVLANEEVENGKSVEGGHPVTRRALRQWMLRITTYAERLLKDLDLLDWPENLKKQQENWIGKSTGMLIHFDSFDTSEKIDVYTTSPDTIFGITYLVLAPEHPMVERLTRAGCKEKVSAYLEEVRNKSDLQRTDLNKDKSGVFLGAYAKHPVTGEKLPLWIADYVLATYATGAVMGVPAHDERDHAFACFHKLKIQPVITPVNGEEIDPASGYFGLGYMIHSEYGDLSLNGLNNQEAKEKASAWLEKEGKGRREVTYKLRDWLFSRQRYWGEPMPILHYEDGTARSLALDELPLLPPEVKDYKPTDDGLSPLAKEPSWVHVVDSKTGKKALRETHTMPQWAGSCWYYLRFLDPHNDQQAWSPRVEKYWMPVDTYVGGAEHAVLHLLYARFWHKVLYDCGFVTTLEPFQQLRNQGVVVAKSYKLKTGGYVPPSEVHQDAHQWIHVPTGEKVTEMVEKMSKSKLNGVNPQSVIREHGADALRLYSMFMGPFDKEKVWENRAISGCSRFLKRVSALYVPEKMTEDEEESAMILIHQLIALVEKELESWQFNVAIAKMMEFLNQLEKLEHYPRSCLDCLARLLAPFAPHLAEELWQVMLGHPDSVAYAPFPVADASWLEKGNQQLTTVVVQVNGKLRAKLILPKGASQETVQAEATRHEGVLKHLEGQPIEKIIFVQDKLLNLVVTSQ